MNSLVTPTSTETVYLKDYTPPNFAVLELNLDICIFADKTIVKSELHVERLHDGDLVLLGRELQLEAVFIDGQKLESAQYHLDDEQLVLKNVADKAKIAIEVIIHPEANTQLEGLYQASKDLFVTQNEPEGFRKITFYPDRPDVLSVFTTRVEADKRFPVLLANGNLIEKGELDKDRHYAVWQDPTKKPSYLFACVIGDLDVLRDEYTTSEGRKVALEIYAERKDIEKCHIAMQALKDSMKWDEVHYGRPYDLDVYMIVATSAFNMGAMENKGLNIFNTSCVLADENVTTDAAVLRVQSVIAHEYFHNWTGNRITCRDWFQLCLKEGLTVFRDQSFSEDMQSPAVQRIDDVSVLKAHQFPEDAGPLSHPARPDHFVEINNFYTATVYEKGAEISRMMATVLGKEKFRQGTDEYFRRHDGQAVTVEDWIAALSAGSGMDMSGFLTWYNQPNTPHLKVTAHYDVTAQTYTLSLQQSIRPHAKYPDLKAVPIPVALALFDEATGEQLILDCDDLMENQVKDGLYLFDQPSATIIFKGVKQPPIISLLRNFSAPVNVDFAYSDAELAFLLRYETNGFNQWQAAQSLLENILLKGHDAEVYLNAITEPALLSQLVSTEPMLAARLLDIPSESYLASRIDDDYNPSDVMRKREALVNAVANQFKGFWKNIYQVLNPAQQSDFAKAAGMRALRNIALDMMARQSNITDTFELAYQQYQQTQNMNERLGALRVLVWHNAPQADAALQDFYQRFKDEDLAIDQWFMIQAAHPAVTQEKIAQLTSHPDYDLATPNRIRSITGGLNARPVNLWKEVGVQHFIALSQFLDEKNPIVAARMIQALSRWYTLAEPQRSQVQSALQQLQSQVKSKNMQETVASMLDI